MPAPSSGLTTSLLGTASGLTAYAQGAAASVNAFIGQIGSAAANINPPSITPSFAGGGSAAPQLMLTAGANIQQPVWQAPGFPSIAISAFDASIQVPSFDAEPPTIVYGEAPAPFADAVPDAPPININFDDPVLKLALPAPPDLLSLNVVKFDGLNIPDLDLTDAPVLTAVEPSIREYTPGAEYTSGLLTGLKATLEERIRTGGVGFDKATEDAIWARGREREARAAQEAIDGLEKMEGLGYAFPPGAYLAARTKLLAETDAQNRGHSREVMVKSAELQLDNVKHALTTAVQLESRLMDMNNAVEQRAFEMAKYATEAAVEIYNAKVRAYSAAVDFYGRKIAIYEARLRGELAKVEVYRASIAAEEAKASINRALVDQYKVQVEAALSSVDVYKAEIQGIQAKAEIEKTKVMIFGEQVRGYTAKVNAYTAQVEGFRARMEGEGTKARVYASQVDAFKARTDAAARVVEARATAYNARVNGETVRVQAYKAEAETGAALLSAQGQYAQAQASVYGSQAQATASYNEVLVKQWQATLDQNQRTAEIGIAAAKANAEAYISARSLTIDAAKAGAMTAAQIGAAALNAVNFSGSVSSSESYSAAESVSNSNSTSQSNSSSNSTNYNYNASV